MDALMESFLVFATNASPANTGKTEHIAKNVQDVPMGSCLTTANNAAVALMEK